MLPRGLKELMLICYRLFTKNIYTTLTLKLHTLQIYVPIIKHFIINCWTLQVESITTSITNHPAKIYFIIPLFPIVLVTTNPDVFFFNWDSFHARLNGHYNAWNHMEKKHTKEIYFERTKIKRCLLVLNLKPFRS